MFHLHHWKQGTVASGSISCLPCAEPGFEDLLQMMCNVKQHKPYGLALSKFILITPSANTLPWRLCNIRGLFCIDTLDQGTQKQKP